MKRGPGVQGVAKGKRRSGKGKTSAVPVAVYTTEASLYQKVQTDKGPMTLQFVLFHEGKRYQVAAQCKDDVKEGEWPEERFWALYTVGDDGAAVPLSELMAVSRPPERKDGQPEESDAPSGGGGD